MVAKPSRTFKNVSNKKNKTVLFEKLITLTLIKFHRFTYVNKYIVYKNPWRSIRISFTKMSTLLKNETLKYFRIGHLQNDHETLFGKKDQTNILNAYFHSL